MTELASPQSTSHADATERRHVRVTGTVQGVGFRPFVYRRAVALGLTGVVRNDSAGVMVEAQGPPIALDELARCLRDEPPPLARVEAVVAAAVPVRAGERLFRIVESTDSGTPRVPVSVDTATCVECLGEVDDPDDRRHRYPFTNCTNCGPRYTIVVSVPYDRPATTMSKFVMCEPCRREYDDPADRRFHAQPNACPRCGPRLRASTPTGHEVASGDQALAWAVAELRRGRILAVKGVGGFHLAVDATDPVAVAELRRRKERDDKPFAVMVRDLQAARALCTLDETAETALRSPRRPIVLAPRRPDARVAHGVAPGSPELGLVLPYTALHHVLISDVDRPVVMTSGNRSDEPIAHTDDDAFERLGPLVDGVVTHDRPIHIRCDDSVGRALDGRFQLLRRSRGYAPEPMALPVPVGHPQVLAVGAELKSTIAVAKDGVVVASHHIGDLEQLPAYRSFLQAADHLPRLYGVDAEVVAHDLHPEYLSTKYALDLGIGTQAVQHHHAHVASCLVDHGRVGPVLGIAFDGLGYGTDGALWGGEFLVADLVDFERVGHLAPVALPGGVAAIREPWRMAVAWAHAALGPDTALALGLELDPRAPSVVELVSRPALVTTAAGRLFDAVAAALGLRARVSYEGQAAIELEALARRVPDAEAPVYPIETIRGAEGIVLDPTALMARVLEERERATPLEMIAAGFHGALGRGTAAVATELADAHGLGTVALTGGVFQNARLSTVVEHALRERGLEVLVHERVPPNDGGISIGQAAIAAATGAATSSGTMR